MIGSIVLFLLAGLAEICFSMGEDTDVRHFLAAGLSGESFPSRK
ncbi:hypothetical protein ACFSO0_04065 [Brevibacillus sp. GCM10020057]